MVQHTNAVLTSFLCKHNVYTYLRRLEENNLLRFVHTVLWSVHKRIKLPDRLILNFVRSTCRVSHVKICSQLNMFKNEATGSILMLIYMTVNPTNLNGVYFRENLFQIACMSLNGKIMAWSNCEIQEPKFLDIITYQIQVGNWKLCCRFRLSDIKQRPQRNHHHFMILIFTLCLHPFSNVVPSRIPSQFQPHPQFPTDADIIATSVLGREDCIRVIQVPKYLCISTILPNIYLAGC